MSGWNNAIDTSEVTVGYDPIPEGDYILQPVSGGEDTFEAGALNIRFQVAAGPQAGRSFFAKLPDPAKHDKKNGKTPWPIVAMKLLETATGYAKAPSENGIEYVNRLAGTGSTFSAKLTLYRPVLKDETGAAKLDASGQPQFDTSKKAKEQMNWMSIRPGVA